MYKSIPLHTNRMYSFLMNDWDEEISGVFIAEGTQWILLYDNQNDFLLDGLRFVHKHNIEEICIDEDAHFKETILGLKYPNLNMNFSYTLDSSEVVLQALKDKDQLLHFDTDDDEEIIVGKIETVGADTFQLKTLSELGTWGESVTLRFSELSSIAIENDYLKSLSLYLNQSEK